MKAAGVPTAVALLGARALVGTSMVAHGAQKLFGAFGGRGLSETGKRFEEIGLRPGRPMAAAAGVCEIGGGVATLVGLGGRAGPIVIASTMATAASVGHRGRPLLARDGPELALSWLAVAVSLAGSGTGRLSLDSLIGWQPSRPFAAAVFAGALTSTFVIIRRAR